MTLIISCSAPKNSGFRLVAQKMDSLNNATRKQSVLKHFHIAKRYKSNSTTYEELDSIALNMGRTYGTGHHIFWVNFFSSNRHRRSDRAFFNENDSLEIIKKKLNLVNYRFENGFFREKQIIKDGKILPPIDVQIIFDSKPKINFVN